MSDETNTPEIPASEIHPESLEAISQETGIPVNEITGAGGVAEAPTEKTAPKSIEELVAGIDIADVTLEQIFRELIGSIQNVAVAAQIALGIAERIRLSELAAGSEAPKAPVVTPELEVV